MKKPYDYKMDEVFREAFEDFKPTPPKHVLNNIKTVYNRQIAGTGISNFINSNWLILSITSVVSLVFVGLVLLNVDINGADKLNDNLLMANTSFIADDYNTPENTNLNNNIVTTVSENTPDNNDNKTEKIVIKNDPADNPETEKSQAQNTRLQPRANAGEYENICGLSCDLHAKYSREGTSGMWTAEPDNVKFGSGTHKIPGMDPNAVIKVDEYGEYTLVWAEYDNQYPGNKSSDKVQIKFIEPPDIDAGDNANICGNTTTLEVKRSKYGGHWNNIAGVKYEDINNPNTNIKYNGSGTLEFIWTENNGSCYFNDNVFVTFSGAPSADFTVQYRPKCYGTPVTLNVTDKSLKRYKWDLGGGTSSGKENDIIKVTWESGTSHDVTLTVWNDRNCSSSETMTIEQPPKLEPGFYHSEPVADMPIPIYFTNTTTVDGMLYYNYIEEISFRWRFGDGAVSTEACPHHFYSEKSKYTVTLYAVTPGGCTDSIVIPGLDLQEQSLVEIPNVFTPNSDGMNDIYRVKVRDLKQFKGIILSRTTGRKIYEWDDPEGGWDGRVDGDDFAAPGVYYCIITGIGNDGKHHHIRGFLELK